MWNRFTEKLQRKLEEKGEMRCGQVKSTFLIYVSELTKGAVSVHVLCPRKLLWWTAKYAITIYKYMYKWEIQWCTQNQQLFECTSLLSTRDFQSTYTKLFPVPKTQVLMCD